MESADRFQLKLMEHESQYGPCADVVARYRLTESERNFFERLEHFEPTSIAWPMIFDFDGFVTTCWLKFRGEHSFSKRWWLQPIQRYMELYVHPKMMETWEPWFNGDFLEPRDTTRTIHPDARALFEESDHCFIPEGRFCSPNARKFYHLLAEAARLCEPYLDDRHHYFDSGVSISASQARGRMHGDLLPLKKTLQPFQSLKEDAVKAATAKNDVKVVRRLNEIERWVQQNVPG